MPVSVSLAALGVAVIPGCVPVSARMSSPAAGLPVISTVAPVIVVAASGSLTVTAASITVAAAFSV